MCLGARCCADQPCWVEFIDPSSRDTQCYEPAVIQVLDQIYQTAKVKYLKKDVIRSNQIQWKNLHIRKIEQEKDNADLVNINVLNEAELLWNLEMRFTLNKIFTYVGQTLIIVNPYKQIDELFSAQAMEDFACSHSSLAVIKQQPHIYAIAILAYRQLFENDASQALVISGESGSGKTVNTKYAMSLLTAISEKAQQTKQAQPLHSISLEGKVQPHTHTATQPHTHTAPPISISRSHGRASSMTQGAARLNYGF